jgi:5'-nucleotidase
VVDLKIDPKTRDVIRTATDAHNVIVTRDVTPDAAVQSIITEAVAKSAPIGNRPVGPITADIVRATAPSGESPLGNVLTDAQLESTAGNGAVIAMTNPGGVRADLAYAGSPAGEGDGVVTYGEAFTVQPFGNILQTITLTGAQLDAVLEQQWQPTVTRILQVSEGFTYTWSTSAPAGSKVSNLALNGTPIDPAASYRVTVNNFLSAGGDGFTAFTGGTNLTGGAIDLDAFTAYLTTHPNLSPPATNRITVVP